MHLFLRIGAQINFISRCAAAEWRKICAIIASAVTPGSGSFLSLLSSSAAMVTLAAATTAAVTTAVAMTTAAAAATKKYMANARGSPAHGSQTCPSNAGVIFRAGFHLFA